MKTKEDILALLEEEDVEFVRLQFTDMFGNLKNAAVTARQLERVLDHDYAFDSCAMFNQNGGKGEDIYLKPDLDTFVILPWRPQQGKVARLLCDVYTQSGEPYEMSSRRILQKVIDEAKKKGYTFFVDPECEFFLFHTDENGMPTALTHEQAGYMDVGPVDLGENARREMVLTLEEMGFEIESSHHEAAPAQHEIDFQEAEALAMADSIVTFKSAVRSIARRFGLHVTFMPKPKSGVAGSGLHLNFSLYKEGKNLFSLGEKGEVSQEALMFMGGIMAHAKAICAISNPLVNSYKRLITGFDAPLEMLWTVGNQNAMLRLRNRRGENSKIELRFPDPSSNPYLVIALALAAGMDGIDRRLNPGKEANALMADAGQVETLPMSLREAVGYLRQDKLLEQVLGQEFTDIYCKAKMQEWNTYMAQVSDWEVETYLNRV
ncbi:MAG: glutamine synthetase family protein [Lachnospiraceae bacterium]|nr:glutamine synthetase family protein [Lachnospiraceae bacterium]MDY3221719.1 glutamine synthetase family protein [Lachnospiraceae bacterium]MDY4096969.1 glutamine synthetase family protein [Lachnospiraceae bacterium]